MTSGILGTIVAAKRDEVSAGKSRRAYASLRSEAEQMRDGSVGPRDFAGSMRARIEAGGTAVIAEVKKASPSQGVIRADFRPAEIAAGYRSGGAACLSVLTDARFFQGSADDLRAARAACALPVLRKDFTVDVWQIAEARMIGADAILLIAAVLDDAELADFEQTARAFGLAVLVEVHDERELDRALRLQTPLVGINNRDLRTFEVTVETTLRLAGRVPEDRIVVSESGIRTPDDVARLHTAGVHAVLVGESLMRAEDPGKALATLIGRSG